MKYIIELNPDCVDGEFFRIPIRVAGEDQWIKTKASLTPYAEPDCKVIEDEVWEFADYMCRMSQTEKNRCFGFSYPSEVTTNLTYQEAKSLFEKWMENENEIHIGDEVEYEDCKFIVTAEIGNKYHGIHSSNGDIVSFGEGDYCRKDSCKKTGRHFPEVAELLEKMKGEEE